MGRVEDQLKISLDFTRVHKTFLVIDPFAATETHVACRNMPGGKSVDFTLEGYQDVLLILATDSTPSVLSAARKP